MTEHEQRTHALELTQDLVRLLPLPLTGESASGIIGARLGVLISLAAKHTLELTGLPGTPENLESLALAIRSSISDWLGRHSPAALN